MRVVFDARMARWTGVGRYITGLCPVLARRDPSLELVLLLNPGDDQSWIPRLPNLCAESCRSRIRPYSLREQVFMAREFVSRKPDIVHVPHFNVPWMSFRPIVTTIHDLIYMIYPQDCPSFLAKWAAARMIRSAARRSERIIADSENTKRDIVELLGENPSKVSVAHLGPPPARPRETSEPAARKFGLDRAYLLYTGNHSPHKNLKTLLDAFLILRSSGRALKLAITGQLDRHSPAVQAHMRRIGVENDVVFTGRIPDDDLFSLYAGASVYVFPSLYEGFGIPPLEAFAHGVPVVASSAASIPEVVGDAAVLVEPNDAAGFAAAIGRFLDDHLLRQEFVSRGRKRLEAFSWERAADATLGVYRECIESSVAAR